MNGKELIIDSFAGGGGASTGIALALGRSVDIAINHDPIAIAMHRINHPSTKHYCESVWDVNPFEATKGQPVELFWLSPDCKHFSKAKGGKPVEKSIRGLAWLAVKWAVAVRPRIIMLENVEEFKTWGPLTPDGYPDPNQKGQTFNLFIDNLRGHGYDVEWRELRACDYGAPTSRKRFFMVARCDGLPIVWPEPAHGDPKSIEVISGRLKPWRTAAEIIDWSLPCPSIFERKKPLAENTMRRIARGIQKFVIDNPEPYIVRIGQTGFSGDGMQYPLNKPLTTIVSKAEHCLVTPFLSQYHSYDDSARGQELDRPILTLDASNRYALVSAFISKFYKTGIGQSADSPLHTVTTSPGHFAEVRAFLTQYYGTGTGSMLSDPLPTIVSKDRFGLVVVGGLNYQITDIGMRMLKPRELYNAQGFDPNYIIDFEYNGKPLPISEQVAKCGNSVPPDMAAALVRANMPEKCQAVA